ncbi:MAG: hypothetical protein EOP24_39520 [Hyphomicrobiales bacterium]|nr:MAG: hypothetical protein EOP24_39520 [Hyphomicrobiales bacterium]
MKFEKATRKKARLRLALTGPSGSGKTMAALMIAKGLGGRTAVLDTEHGSASLYAEPMTLANGAAFEPPEFDALELTAPYSPERYIEAIKAAEAAGYDTLIIDSTTHEWSGSGGCLEINDTVAAAKFRGNSWSAWNETTPRHRAFIDAMLQSKMHIIATGRSKTDTAQTEENGRKKVVKLGMKTEQRDGFEYEFTAVLDLVHDGHFAIASKDRTGLFTGGDPEPITAATGQRLLSWLESGVEGPDVAAILASIESARTVELLRTNFEAAMQMLPPHHQKELTKAKNKRYRELQPIEKDAA